jgi:hypothetical protein
MKNTNKKLKLLFLIFIFILIDKNLCYSQIQRDSSKYEIGLGSAYAIGIIHGRLNPNISFKYKYGKNATRSGISYYCTNPKSSGKKGILGNIGYERRLFGPNIQMIAGVDLCYLYWYEDFNNEQNPSESSKTTFNHYGIGPILGCVYNFNRKFSVQTELGLYWGRGIKKTVWDKDNFSRIEKGMHYSTDQRAFSLHLYYNFGVKRKRIQ